MYVGVAAAADDENDHDDDRGDGEDDDGRDANLWRPKIGRLSFFYFPPPLPPRPEKLTQPPMGMT